MRPTIQMIPCDALRAHPQNPNVMSAAAFATLTAHLARSGRCPPLIVRPCAAGGYQILDGHSRWAAAQELDWPALPCVVWEVDDAEALLLLATLNRLHGEDDPARRAALLHDLVDQTSLAELARWLPESEAELEATLGLGEVDLDAAIAELEAVAARESAAAPRAYTFLVDPSEAATVDRALAAAQAPLRGANRGGRALVALATVYLAQAEGGAHVAR